ncbi:MAG TPA: ferritin-like protein [Chitinophaga sp.]|uniref:ferritin-like domain-containing protein n=1 Tax=Chitinophaga sp. TaxID=1869181 RepID=UPI002C3C453D|nr:ferritin-like protein [Chitinophaga sp.]HVI47308.1 ferritin-like protein [Chitinophaga sp.]
MSYLQFPRLQFSGRFQADPSTVNNDPYHFNTKTFQSSFDLPGPGASNGWWNPGGTGAWRFYECTVQRVYYLDGTWCDDPAIDPVIGMPLTGADSRAEGKIVDLDPEQQMVSELWGFQVILGSPAQTGFKSDFQVAPFGDIFVRYPPGQADSFFGAYWQSVLRVKSWHNMGESRFLKELDSVTIKDPDTRENILSIKFNVDGFQDDSTKPGFTLGRVVGTIGQQTSSDPDYFVAGRLLAAIPGAQPALNNAYCLIDKNNILHIDLGNSLPTAAVGGPLANVGNLRLCAATSTGLKIVNELRYEDCDWYKNNSGLISFALTPEQLTLVSSNPLCVCTDSPIPGIQSTLLSESPDATFVRADKFVFRMYPGETASTKFYATQYGKPLASAQISLIFDPTVLLGQVTQGPLPGPRIVGEPTSALKVEKSITTGADGTVVLSIGADDPGNPRKYIDGQLYCLDYQLGPTPPPIGATQNGNMLLNFHVYDKYKMPDVPNWVEHVQPIFQQYADLYPVMKPIVDLSDYGSVKQRINILKNVFSADITSPNYMPVTRDLSGGKQAMILKWLDNPVYMDLDSKEDLLRALQTAIELEHSTIPPYLYALYSIRQGCNTEVAGLIRSVAVEEMLHMALVANIMISIGGSPNINHNRFVPKYPGSLPGGLCPGLTVRLRRCSIEQIRDCFMAIEEPEGAVLERFRASQASFAPDQHLYTIGWFYGEVKKALKVLSDSNQITFGNIDKQVSKWSGMGTLYTIGSLDDALKAIDEILDQGEGKKSDDPMTGQGDLAHYYKFSEIVAGHRLVEHDGEFSYTGDVIPFDPAGVYPVVDDPQPMDYPKGSQADFYSNEFTRSYQALLNGLHETFNGNPDHLNEAIGSMYSIDVQARRLMQTPSGKNDGTTAGPTFQLPYVY